MTERAHRLSRPEGLTCTGCGKTLDAWRAMEPGTRPRAPRKGRVAISVCAYCGTIHKFTGRPLRLERVDGDEPQRVSLPYILGLIGLGQKSFANPLGSSSR